jgi:ligand-binding sensor domain-containing protein
MRTLRKLIEMDTRLVTWLAGRLGLWRIDVILYLAKAIRADKLAAQLEAGGFPGQAAQVSAVATAWRGHARRCVPDRAASKWREAVTVPGMVGGWPA